MTFESIDALQRTLADTVFQYAVDRKKAAGRALGTLVEVVTFCLLRAWGLSSHVIIERRIPEFANPRIHHNVEFSLHPVQATHGLDFCSAALPLTGAKLRRQLPMLQDSKLKSVQVLGRDYLKRNAALLTEREEGPVVANITAMDQSRLSLDVCELSADPFAIFECKRVGVEEGMRKGPQTIEKAKQGAYVARSVSSLQKVRLRNGRIYGVIENADGTFRTGPYRRLLNEVIGAPAEFPSGFMLTVGIVSNHGNWFTSDDQNKELRVLAQSYDWLLFLSDDGLVQFIEDLLIAPSPGLEAAREAFHQSYSGKRGKNRFTKVRMDCQADEALKRYFADKASSIDSWFNVISPRGGTLRRLKADLRRLARKFGTGQRRGRR